MRAALVAVVTILALSINFYLPVINASFQPNSIWTVYANGTVKTPMGSTVTVDDPIEYAAENANANDVIQINQGDYTDDVNVTKPLTFMGVGGYPHIEKNTSGYAFYIEDGVSEVKFVNLFIDDRITGNNVGTLNFTNVYLTTMVVVDSVSLLYLLDTTFGHPSGKTMGSNYPYIQVATTAYSIVMDNVKTNPNVNVVRPIINAWNVSAFSMKNAIIKTPKTVAYFVRALNATVEIADTTIYDSEKVVTFSSVVGNNSLSNLTIVRSMFSNITRIGEGYAIGRIQLSDVSITQIPSASTNLIYTHYISGDIMLENVNYQGQGRLIYVGSSSPYPDRTLLINNVNATSKYGFLTVKGPRYNISITDSILEVNSTTTVEAILSVENVSSIRVEQSHLMSFGPVNYGLRVLYLYGNVFMDSTTLQANTILFLYSIETPGNITLINTVGSASNRLIYNPTSNNRAYANVYIGMSNINANPSGSYPLVEMYRISDFQVDGSTLEWLDAGGIVKATYLQGNVVFKGSTIRLGSNGYLAYFSNVISTIDVYVNNTNILGGQGVSFNQGNGTVNFYMSGSSMKTDYSLGSINQLVKIMRANQIAITNSIVRYNGSETNARFLYIGIMNGSITVNNSFVNTTSTLLYISSTPRAVNVSISGSTISVGASLIHGGSGDFNKVVLTGSRVYERAWGAPVSYMIYASTVGSITINSTDIVWDNTIYRAFQTVEDIILYNVSAESARNLFIDTDAADNITLYIAFSNIKTQNGIYIGSLTNSHYVNITIGATEITVNATGTNFNALRADRTNHINIVSSNITVKGTGYAILVFYATGNVSLEDSLINIDYPYAAVLDLPNDAGPLTVIINGSTLNTSSSILNAGPVNHHYNLFIYDTSINWITGSPTPLNPIVYGGYLDYGYIEGLIVSSAGYPLFGSTVETLEVHDSRFDNLLSLIDIGSQYLTSASILIDNVSWNVYNGSVPWLYLGYNSTLEITGSTLAYPVAPLIKATSNSSIIINTSLLNGYNASSSSGIIHYVNGGGNLTIQDSNITAYNIVWGTGMITTSIDVSLSDIVAYGSFLHLEFSQPNTVSVLIDTSDIRSNADLIYLSTLSQVTIWASTLTSNSSILSSTYFGGTLTLKDSVIDGATIIDVSQEPISPSLVSISNSGVTSRSKYSAFQIPSSLTNMVSYKFIDSNISNPYRPVNYSSRLIVSTYISLIEINNTMVNIGYPLLDANTLGDLIIWKSNISSIPDTTLYYIIETDSLSGRLYIGSSTITTNGLGVLFSANTQGSPSLELFLVVANGTTTLFDLGGFSGSDVSVSIHYSDLEAGVSVFSTDGSLGYLNVTESNIKVSRSAFEFRSISQSSLTINFEGINASVGNSLISYTSTSQISLSGDIRFTLVDSIIEAGANAFTLPANRIYYVSISNTTINQPGGYSFLFDTVAEFNMSIMDMNSSDTPIVINNLVGPLHIENTTITSGNSGIKILSSSPGSAINVQYTSVSSATYALQVLNGTLDSFRLYRSTLNGSSGAIYLPITGNTSIKDSLLNSSGIGIELNDGNLFEIKSSTIIGNDYAIKGTANEIRLEDTILNSQNTGLWLSSSGNLSITNTTINAATTGVYADLSGSTIVSNSTITGGITALSVKGDTLLLQGSTLSSTITGLNTSLSGPLTIESTLIDSPSSSLIASASTVIILGSVFTGSSIISSQGQVSIMLTNLSKTTITAPSAAMSNIVVTTSLSPGLLYIGNYLSIQNSILSSDINAVGTSPLELHLDASFVNGGIQASASNITLDITSSTLDGGRNAIHATASTGLLLLTIKDTTLASTQETLNLTAETGIIQINSTSIGGRTSHISITSSLSLVITQTNFQGLNISAGTISSRLYTIYSTGPLSLHGGSGNLYIEQSTITTGTQSLAVLGGISTGIQDTVINGSGSVLFNSTGNLTIGNSSIIGNNVGLVASAYNTIVSNTLLQAQSAVEVYAISVSFTNTVIRGDAQIYLSEARVPVPDSTSGRAVFSNTTIESNNGLSVYGTQYTFTLIQSTITSISSSLTLNASTVNITITNSSLRSTGEKALSLTSNDARISIEFSNLNGANGVMLSTQNTHLTIISTIVNAMQIGVSITSANIYLQANDADISGIQVFVINSINSTIGLTKAGLDGILTINSGQSLLLSTKSSAFHGETLSFNAAEATLNFTDTSINTTSFTVNASRLNIYLINTPITTLATHFNGDTVEAILKKTTAFITNLTIQASVMVNLNFSHIDYNVSTTNISAPIVFLSIENSTLFQDNYITTHGNLNLSITSTYMGHWTGPMIIDSTGIRYPGIGTPIESTEQITLSSLSILDSPRGSIVYVSDYSAAQTFTRLEPINASTSSGWVGLIILSQPPFGYDPPSNNTTIILAVTSDSETITIKSGEWADGIPVSVYILDPLQGWQQINWDSNWSLSSIAPGTVLAIVFAPPPEENATQPGGNETQPPGGNVTQPPNGNNTTPPSQGSPTGNEPGNATSPNVSGGEVGESKRIPVMAWIIFLLLVVAAVVIYPLMKRRKT